jgi:hypothetical protein
MHVNRKIFMFSYPSLHESLSSKYAGQKFVGQHPTKVVDQESAEVDDIGVVRDGDHLYLLET